MENYVHELRYSQETYQIIGAAMKVHSLLGPGFTEKVYQDALALEFMERGIPFKREVELHASYKGVTLDSTYKPDFICYDIIIVELKAVKEIDDFIVHKLSTTRRLLDSSSRFYLILDKLPSKKNVSP